MSRARLTRVNGRRIVIADRNSRGIMVESINRKKDTIIFFSFFLLFFSLSLSLSLSLYTYTYLYVTVDAFSSNKNVPPSSNRIYGGNL